MLSARRILPVSITVALGLLTAAAFYGSVGSPRAMLLRTPNGGIQPQAAMDPKGGLHLIYFSGDPSAGDIFYVVRPDGASEFSKPLRVNSLAGSAVAIGTVRGPQMSMDPDGRVYVVWFGSKDAKPRGPGGATPILFSRLNEAGTAFEPQRCLMQYAVGVDGGLSVAAGQRGDVYVVWHAEGSEPGEAHRRVYLARSTDNGKTFSQEMAISPADLGACGCCGMRAMVDPQGKLFVFYRAAGGGVGRDMTMLVSANGGETFQPIRVGPWKLNACPMSTASLNSRGGRMLAAWETEGQVYFDKIDASSLALSEAVTPAASSKARKHPAIASNDRGWTLFSWTEGTGWKKGGSLAWQMYDPAGKPAGAEGRAAGVPVWGLSSVVADREGNFTIVY